jgi:hypothetical protein
MRDAFRAHGPPAAPPRISLDRLGRGVHYVYKVFLSAKIDGLPGAETCDTH